MVSRQVLTSLAAASLLAAALTARQCRAEPSPAERETARQLMDDGYALRAKNDLKGALARFEAADQIMHVPTTGFEVAHTQVPLGLLVEARDTIARIRLIPAKPGEPAPFKDARAKAEQLDASIVGRVPRLTVVVHGAPSGHTLSLSIDGAAVPAAVIGLSREVDPGHHVIVVSAEGAEGRAEGSVQEGETKSLDVTLVPTGSPAAAAVSPGPAAGDSNAEAPATPRISHSPDALTYVSGGVAGAGLIVGAVTGAVSWSKTSSLSSACPGHACPPASFSAYDSANSLATVSTISFVAAGVGACIAVISMVVGHEDKSGATSSSAAQLSPWIGVGAAGLRGFVLTGSGRSCRRHPE